MPEPLTPSHAFADWVNATRAMLKWPPEALASIHVNLDGAACGFAAAARKVATEIHARQIELHNQLNDQKS